MISISIFSHQLGVFPWRSPLIPIQLQVFWIRLTLFLLPQGDRGSGKAQACERLDPGTHIAATTIDLCLMLDVCEKNPDTHRVVVIFGGPGAE